MELTLQLASTQGLIPAMRSSGARSALAPVKAQLQLWLLDEDVGAVLGKRGQTLTQIQQVGWRGMQGQGKLCVCVGGGGGKNNRLIGCMCVLVVGKRGQTLTQLQ
jgi:hypothetical protein